MNKFFTILFIPEKTDRVRRFLVPAAYLRIAVTLGFIGSFFVAFMIYDYVNVMQQLTENRKLVLENRQLRERVQGFSNKLASVEESLERIQTFSTKLRIITNQGEEDVEQLREKADREFPGVPMDDHSVTPGTDSTDRRFSPEPRTDHSATPFPLQLWSALPAGIGGPSLTLGPPEYLLASNRPVPRHLGGKIPDLLRTSRPKSSSSRRKKTPTKRLYYPPTRISEILQQDADHEVNVELEQEFSKLHRALSDLYTMSKSVEIDIQDLASTLLDQRDYLAAMPTLKPTRGWYTSGFGMRISPYTGIPAMHEGLDIANHYGKTISSPAAGTVSFAGVRPGYGKLITIDHGYGLQTQYGHVSKFYVKEGTRVKRGTKIGAIGNTGRSTGPHVHYEVRVNGIPVNPYFYILND